MIARLDVGGELAIIMAPMKAGCRVPLSAAAFCLGVFQQDVVDGFAEQSLQCSPCCCFEMLEAAAQDERKMAGDLTGISTTRFCCLRLSLPSCRRADRSCMRQGASGRLRFARRNCAHS